jgi:hypothetical protein
MLKKYVANQDSWWKSVEEIVIEDIAQPASSSMLKSKKKNEEASSRKLVGREEAKHLFLRVLHLGDFQN